MKNRILLVLFLFLTQTSFARLSNILTCKNFPQFCLIAKVELANEKFFYGTAILFKTTKDRFYFLTNHHVLPHKSKWAHLRLRTYLYDNPLANTTASEAVRVEGYAPGKDLAVISILRNSGDMYSIKVMTLPPESYLRKEYIDNSLVSTGLYGYSGNELETSKNQPSWTTKLFLESLEVNAGPYSNPVRIYTQEHCPAPFLRSCYRVPLLSFGYSGGALFVTDKKNNQPEIAGIVSHFAPLLGFTYVIPMPEALQEAEKILYLASREGIRPATVYFDDTQSFRIVETGEVKILKGKFKDKWVQGRNIVAAGGDDGSIGGDDGTVGGDDGSIGGDKSQTLHTFLRSESGRALIKTKFSDLEDALGNPNYWGERNSPFSILFQILRPLKGFATWLRFKPGVYLFDKTETKVVHQLNGRSIGNMSAFLKEYLKTDAPQVTDTIAPIERPKHLELVRHRQGITTFVSLRRLKSAAELDDIQTYHTRQNFVAFSPFSSKSSKNPLEGFDIMALASAFRPLVWKLETEGLDLVYSDIPFPIHSSFPGLRIEEKNVIIEDYRCGELTLKPLGNWTQIGERLYSYTGYSFLSGKGQDPCNTSKRINKESPVALTMTLQLDPIENLWEYKVLLGYVLHAPMHATSPFNSKTIQLLSFSAWLKE